MAGRDVGWAVAQGQFRPINEVLTERRKSKRAQSRELADRAFKRRAFLQAQLASCLCTYPLELHPTSSEHAPWCPGHHLHVSDIEADRVACERAEQERAAEAAP